MVRQKLITLVLVAAIGAMSMLTYMDNSLVFKPAKINDTKWIIKEKALNSKDHQQKVYTQEDSLSLLRDNSVSDSDTLMKLDLSTLSYLQVTLTLHSVLGTTEVFCKRKIRLGNLGDGGWEVCDDPSIAPTPRNCLVYSFGIENDVNFDYNIAAVYGCQVHSFDPIMPNKSHQISPRVHFHNIGISNKSEVNTLGWQLDTLGGIRKRLNHTETPIDVLKIDDGFAEWSSLSEMFKSGQMKTVKQFLVEFQTTPPSEEWYRDNTGGNFTEGEEARRRLGLVKTLLTAGFRAFYVHKNDHTAMDIKGFPGKTSASYEIHYINTKMMH